MIFTIPFANAGDKTAIPEPLQLDGSVSITTGYPIGYQNPDPLDPDYKDVERAKMNWLFGEITDGLGKLQQYGFYPWEARTWEKHSWVRHNDEVYMAMRDTAVEPSNAVPLDWWNMSRAIGSASTTVEGIARFATLAEHTTPVSSALMTNPAGVRAMIQAFAPRTVINKRTATVNTISVQNTWVTIPSLTQTINTHSDRKYTFISKVNFLVPEVSTGDNYVAVRLFDGIAALDVTTHNVTGEHVYSLSSMLTNTGHQWGTSGARTLSVQILKTMGANIIVNADSHNGTNASGQQSVFTVVESF